MMNCIRFSKQLQMQFYLFSKAKSGKVYKPPVPPLKQPNTQLKTPVGNPNVKKNIDNNKITNKVPQSPKMAGGL